MTAKRKLTTLHRHPNAYVVAALMASAGAWLSMSPAVQADLLASLPWLHISAPALGFIAYVLGHVFSPSPAQEPANG